MFRAVCKVMQLVEVIVKGDKRFFETGTCGAIYITNAITAFHRNKQALISKIILN